MFPASPVMANGGGYAIPTIFTLGIDHGDREIPVDARRYRLRFAADTMPVESSGHKIDGRYLAKFFAIWTSS